MSPVTVLTEKRLSNSWTGHWPPNSSMRTPAIAASLTLDGKPMALSSLLVYSSCCISIT